MPYFLKTAVVCEKDAEWNAKPNDSISRIFSSIVNYTLIAFTC